MTLPGRYTVRLTVDGQSQTAPLEVVMDPRVKTPLADLQAQQAFAGELRGVLADAVNLHEQAAAVEKKLTAGKDGASKDGASKGAKATAALEKWKTAYDVDDIAGTLTAIATDVESADAAPTQPQRDVLAMYRARLQQARQAWQKAGLAGR
jgi:hypothetical protein